MDRPSSVIALGLAAGAVLLAVRSAQAENNAALGELTIRGHSIVELTLVERTQLSQLRFENPGASVRLPPGQYRVERVELQDEFVARAAPARPDAWFDVSAEGPNELIVGAPLYATAAARRYGTFLRLDYDLVDGAGRSYRQALEYSDSLPPPPRFAVFKDGRQNGPMAAAMAAGGHGVLHNRVYGHSPPSGYHLCRSVVYRPCDGHTDGDHDCQAEQSYGNTEHMNTSAHPCGSQMTRITAGPPSRHVLHYFRPWGPPRAAKTCPQGAGSGGSVMSECLIAVSPGLTRSARRSIMFLECLVADHWSARVRRHILRPPGGGRSCNGGVGAMRLCYVDEAGCTGVLPAANSPIQPCFVIVGLVVEQGYLSSLTAEFLRLKRRFFPAALPTATHNLEWVLYEVKGAELRRHVRDHSRRRRRHALGFLDKLVALLEDHNARVFGRLWIKGIGGPFDGTAVYTSSMQKICKDFQHLLEELNSKGFVIADSRNKPKNANVSHSIFTQKFRAAGDEYPNILEMVTFGHSDNHVGLQVCDLICSALLFPMAAYSYCRGHVDNIHVRNAYAVLKTRYGSRLKALQHRYQDMSGRWRGGITVSDALSHLSGGHLF